MKQSSLKNNPGFFEIYKEKLKKLDEFDKKITNPRFQEKLKDMAQPKNHPQFIELFQQLEDLSSHFTTPECWSAISSLTPKDAVKAYNLYRVIIALFCELFQNTQDIYQEWNLTFLRYYFSFFSKISHIPLDIPDIEGSFRILQLCITLFLERLNENEIQEILQMIDNVIQSLDSELDRLKRSADNELNSHKREELNKYRTELQSSIYSMILSNYCFIYEAYPEYMSLSKIIRLMNKCNKIKLSMLSYILCMEIISATKEPDFSLIYMCFNKSYKQFKNETAIEFQQRSKEEREEFKEKQFNRILFSFQKVLTKIKLRPLTESSKDLLNARSLDELLKMFNDLKTKCSIHSYLSVIHIMSLRTNLLNITQLESIYSYANHVLDYAMSTDRPFNYDSIRDFFIQILRLASVTDAPDLNKLMPVYQLCLTNFSEESFEWVRQPMLSLLLKKRQYPDVDLFCNLLEQVMNKTKLQPNEIERLLSNITTFYPQEQINHHLIKICNRYKKEIATEKSLIRLVIELERSFLEKLEDGAILIQYQTDYQALQELISQACLEIVEITKIDAFKKLKMRTIQIIQSIAMDNDNQWSIDEDKIFIEQLKMQYLRLYQLHEKASSYDISIKQSIAEFIHILREARPSIDLIETHISNCEEKVNDEIKQIEEDKSNHLEFDEAQMMLKEGKYDNLLKINRWLRVPGTNENLLLMKIQCLKKLGYYEQALVWLEKAEQIFSEKMDIQFYMHWADCCISLGQYQTALEAYQDIYKKSDKKNINYHLRMQIAFCHQKLGTLENFAQASRIFSELKEQLKVIHEKSSHRQYKEKTINQIKRVSVAELRGQIFNNKLSLTEADDSISALRISEIEKLILQAESYQMQNLFQEAAIRYDQALQEQFEFKWMKALLNCYVLNNDFKNDQVQRFNALLEKHFQPVPEYFELEVNVLMQQKKYSDALEKLEMMQMTYGINQYVCLQKSRCYANLGDTEEALKILRAFPDNRKNKVILRQLGIIYAQAKMPQEALDCFDYLLNEYPMFNPAYSNAILYCIFINDKERVVKYWTQYNEIIEEKSNQTYQRLSAKVDDYLTNASDDPSLQETMCSLELPYQDDEMESEVMHGVLEEDDLYALEEDSEQATQISLLGKSMFLVSEHLDKTDMLKGILNIPTRK